LWPPLSLPPKVSRTIEQTLRELYELAEDMAKAGDSTLRDNLNEAYFNPDLFSQTGDERGQEAERAGRELRDLRLQEDLDLPDESRNPPWVTREPPKHSLLEGRRRDVWVQFGQRFKEIGEKVARANNLLSLVIESADGEMIIFGDIQGQALKEVVTDVWPRYMVALAPHHGTVAVPAAFPRAGLCISQAGLVHSNRWGKHRHSHTNSGHGCLNTHEVGHVQVRLL